MCIRDSVGGVLTIVTAGIEKVADVVRLDHLKQAIHILLRLFGVFLEIDLITAGAQRGGRCMFKGLHGLVALLVDVDEVFIENAVDAIEAAVNFLNALVPTGFCLLYTSPSPRDGLLSRMPSSA